MKKVKVKMNKPVYLGLPILEISKTIMYQFCHDYIKLMYQTNAKIYYTDTSSFNIHIKTEDFIGILQMILKKYLIHQIMKLIDHYQKERIKK